MTEKCILSNFYYVPKSRIRDIDKIKKDLTVSPIWFNRDEPKPKPIVTYRVTSKYIGLPVSYGLEHYYDPDHLNLLSSGQPLIAPKRPDPNHVNASANQAEYMRDLCTYFEDEYVGLAKAGTGTGKTVAALNLAAELGVSTVIITDNTFLGFKQWIPEAKDKLGLTDKDIGIIQGDRCEYDRPFVVAIARSLLVREYPKAMKTAFGLAVWDELHKFGAREMHKTFSIFQAQNRLGQTATDKRNDGAEQVFFSFFGKPSIVAKSNALACRVRVKDYISGKPPTGKRAARIQNLVRDYERNAKIIDHIINWYNQGMHILVTGDNIQHLQRIEELCWKAGVPETHTGQFSRQRYIYVSEPRKHHKTGRDITVKIQKTATMSNDYLEWVKNNARIIFSTYGMIKEGIDIPRLNRGVDITPRSDGAQLLGRLRRPLPDKIVPEWLTIRDRSCEALVRATADRIRDYKSTGGVEVIEDGRL